MKTAYKMLIALAVIAVVGLIGFLVWWFKFRNKPYIHKRADQKGWNEILSEKRLNKRNLYFSKLADKIQAKTLTSLPSSRILWVGYTKNDLSLLPSINLPKKYIIKANHGSGWNIIVDLDKENPNWDKIQKTCNKWLTNKYSRIEKHYHDISPRIFVEEFVDILEELKFHCFNGQVVFIEHLKGGDLSECSWYSKEWEKLNIQGVDKVYSGVSCKPQNLKDLIQIVESDVHKIKILDYVRYDTMKLKNGNTLFGEFTLTPAGLDYSFKPYIFEQLLGSFLETQKNDLVKLQLFIEPKKNWLYNHFDRIVTITLPNRIENVLKFTKKLNSENIIHPATLKNKLSLSELVENGSIVPLKERSKKLTKGRIACHLSHIQVLKNFLTSNAETCLIFEDDNRTDFNPVEINYHLTNSLKYLPKDWDYLNLSTCWNNCNKITYIGGNLFRSIEAVCRNAYAVSRKGAKIIIEKTLPLGKLSYAGDETIKILVKHGLLNYYSIHPRLFSQNRENLGTNLENKDNAPEWSNNLKTCSNAGSN